MHMKEGGWGGNGLGEGGEGGADVGRVIWGERGEGERREVGERGKGWQQHDST